MSASAENVEKWEINKEIGWAIFPNFSMGMRNSLFISQMNNPLNISGALQ